MLPEKKENLSSETRFEPSSPGVCEQKNVKRPNKKKRNKRNSVQVGGRGHAHLLLPEEGGQVGGGGAVDGAGGRALVQRNEQLRFGGVQARDALDDDAQRRLVAEGGADAAHHLRLHVATHLGVALKFQQKKKV